MTAPRVSVGLPVYNAERYVSQAIDAILAQSFRDLELIISDNASTDRTASICLAYAAKDPRVKYHRNEINLGAAVNFNRVFELSSGEYFKWAPYDDAIEPEYLAACVAALDRHPDAVVCYTRARIIDEHGAFVIEHDPGPDTSSARPSERFASLILRPQYALQLMNVIRSSALRTTMLHGKFPSSDEVLLGELALRGRFHEIADRLYIYRRHAEQSTKETQQRLRILFFDTSVKGKIVLPTWRYAAACAAAVRRSPVGALERARCYWHLLRWALAPAHFRALGKDVLLALSQLLHSKREREPIRRAYT